MLQVLLLTVSFFVLVTIQKVEKKWIRIFGYVIVGILWLSVALAIVMMIKYSHRPLPMPTR